MSHTGRNGLIASAMDTQADGYAKRNSPPCRCSTRSIIAGGYFPDLAVVDIVAALFDTWASVSALVHEQSNRSSDSLAELKPEAVSG